MKRELLNQRDVVEGARSEEILVDLTSADLEDLTGNFGSRLVSCVSLFLTQVGMVEGTEGYDYVQYHAMAYGHQIFNVWRNAICEDNPDFGEPRIYPGYIPNRGDMANVIIALDEGQGNFSPLR